MNYEKLEKELTEFLTKHKEDVLDCIDDAVHDILMFVKENEE